MSATRERNTNSPLQLGRLARSRDRGPNVHAKSQAAWVATSSSAQVQENRAVRHEPGFNWHHTGIRNLRTQRVVSVCGYRSEPTRRRRRWQIDDHYPAGQVGKGRQGYVDPNASVGVGHRDRTGIYDASILDAIAVYIDDFDRQLRGGGIQRQGCRREQTRNERKVVSHQ